VGGAGRGGKGGAYVSFGSVPKDRQPAKRENGGKVVERGGGSNRFGGRGGTGVTGGCHLKKGEGGGLAAKHQSGKSRAWPEQGGDMKQRHKRSIFAVGAENDTGGARKPLPFGAD